MAKIVHISDIHWRGIARHKEYTKAFTVLFEELKLLKPDLIVNTGDTFHTKTQGITPEVIQKLAWMLNELANIAPMITLLGNHDGNLTNSSRQDIITPIHEAVGNNNSVLLKKSETHVYDIKGVKLAFHAFSVFDRDGWRDIKQRPDCVNIALYHGSVTGCQMDNNWRLPECDNDVGFFSNFDFAFLGDIHKHQYLGRRPDKDGVEKPWIGYPGSLIQQNYGEEIKKGYLVWDIKEKNDWEVSWRKLTNFFPFVTIPWQGSVTSTLRAYEDLHGKYAYMPETRYRISSDVNIPQVQTHNLIKLLKEDRGAAEITFKTDIISKMDSINAAGVTVSKKSLSQDPEAIIKLYQKFINAHNNNYQFTNEQLETVSFLIKGYLDKLNARNHEFVEAKNVNWSIKELKFDNLYGYGKNNIINFQQLENIVGIFGANRIGKSSVIGALMYALFNATDRGSVKNSHIINCNADYCSASARISVGGTDWVIERRTTRKIPKVIKKKADEHKTVATVNLWEIVVRDGQEIKVERNGDGGPDTDKCIQKLIGTSEDFLLTAFASQGNINKFIEYGATKRKETLNRFLELNVFEKLFNFAKDDYSSLNSLTKNYTTRDWVKLIERTEREIAKLEADIDSCETRMEAVRERRDELNIWIKSHEKEAAAVEVSSFDDLESHIDNYEKELQTTEEQLKNNKASLRKTTTELRLTERKIQKINLEKLNEELESMENLRQNIAELKRVSGLEEAKLQTQQKAVVKLNVVPCGDKFPSCHFIKDGHEAKKTIKAQEKLVKSFVKNLSTTQKLFDKYASKNIREKLNEHSNMIAKKQLLESNIRNYEDKVEYDVKNIKIIKKELRASKSKLNKAKKSIERLETEEFKRKVQQFSKAEEERYELNAKKNEMFVQLGGKREALNKLLIEQTEGKDLIQKLKLYESVQVAFSKTGIPAMVLKSQLPAINREVAKILDGVVGFDVVLETDVTSNIMDVYIDDGKGRRIVELGSGMEKTISSIAIRVALGNLSSLPRPDVFILDESFGALDEDNMQKGMELLSLFRGYFKSVFVITHASPIKEIADHIIEIKNDGIKSSINLEH